MPNWRACARQPASTSSGDDGVYRVLEDNVRCPSGVSYVMTNRRAINSALPEVAGKHRIQPRRGLPVAAAQGAGAATPSGVADPTVVVLTPGVYNSAYFEHALLARMMGVELVEGRDLVAHGGHVSLRTTRGDEAVHVIYRRIDDDFLDPAVFRADSLLGCAERWNAARRPATSPSPTLSATASPTTSSSTPTCRT